MSRIRLSNTPAFEPKQDEMTVPPTDSHSERSKLLAMLDDFNPAKTVDVSVTDNADIEISRANVSATDTYRSENVSATERGVSVTEMVKEALIHYLGDEAREWL